MCLLIVAGATNFNGVQLACLSFTAIQALKAAWRLISGSWRFLT